MASTLPRDQNAPHTGTYLKSNAKEINFRLKTTKCDDSTYRQILAYPVDSSMVSKHAHEISGNGYSKKSAMPFGKRMRRHVLKPETTKRNGRNETTETS